ncbi:Saccharopepsin [Diplonema papillatum]|nr:Saccharopepsin [Diplonema papillatum]
MRGTAVAVVLLAACGLAAGAERPFPEIELGKQRGAVPEDVRRVDAVHKMARLSPIVRVRGHDVPLVMLSVLTYMTATIGTPGKALKLLVDTGSSTLAVPSERCATCEFRCPDCFYAESRSTTGSPLPCGSSECLSGQSCTRGGSCQFALRYADNTGETGDILRDVVRVGGFNATIFLGSVTRQDPPDTYSISGVDGIAGVGGRYHNFGGMRSPTLVDQIIEDYQLPDVLSMAVGRQDVKNSGVLHVGSMVASRYRGSLQWTPLESHGFYTVVPVCLSVGPDSVAASADDFGTQSIVDSGTTITFLPPTVFNRIKRSIRRQCGHLPHVTPRGVGDAGTIFESKACYTNVDVSQFPPLHFAFAGDVVVSVAPEHYFIDVTDDESGRKFYCFGIAPSGPTEDWTLPDMQTILGDTFMSAFYIAFNRGNGSMGIAPSVHSQRVPPSSDADALKSGNCAVPAAPRFTVPFSVVFIFFVLVGFLAYHHICVAQSTRRLSRSAEATKVVVSSANYGTI